MFCGRKGVAKQDFALGTKEARTAPDPHSIHTVPKNGPFKLNSDRSLAGLIIN